MKAKDVLTGLEELGLADKLKARYFDEWRKADALEWHDIKAKLSVVDDVMAELRKAGNAEGVDNARTRA